MKKILFLSAMTIILFTGCNNTTQNVSAPTKSKIETTWISDNNGCKVWNPNPQPTEAITWSGSCQNGYATGEGLLQWYVNGKYSSSYNGMMLNGKFDGKGILTYSDGQKYEGEFKNDKKDGKGITTYPDGQKYEGEYKNDKFDGRGIYTSPDGRKYEGEFKNGKFDGKGIITYPNGSKYEGEFKNNLPNGKGVITQANGTKEEGYFKEGTNVLNLIKNDIVTDQNGCKLINPNPSQNGKESITWTGSCRDGFLNGYGIMTWYLNGKKNENGKPAGVFNGIYMKEENLHSADYGLYILSSIRKNINVKNTNYKKFILNETIGLSAVINNVWEGTANYYIDNKPYAKRISSGKSRINKAWFEITEGYLSIGVYDYPGKYIFFDGTELEEGLLKFVITHKGQNYIAYENEKENFLNNKRTIEEKQRNIEVTTFRKTLKEGDETSAGLVVQIKGDLIKVQTNDSQCSQREYNGSCRTWINTPVEKWLKRSEIYPR